jgi:hypothetical protein
MRKSFGMVMLLIVLVAVLLLVAEAWERFAPTAIEIDGAGQELHSGRLPRLQDAQARTDTHVDNVEQALQAAE